MYMNDSILDLHRLVYEIFSDPCWRGSKLPDNEIEFKMRDVLGRLRIEEQSYKDTIMKQDDLIKSLASKLEQQIKFHN